MRNKKQVLGFLGVSVSLVGVLVLMGTVWWAFLFNDGWFVVTIMRFNEGLLEFIVLPVLCMLCVYGVLSLKNIRYDHVFQRNVMKNNKSSGKVCVPLDLVGKKVYVVCLVEES
jgi:putative transposon-encoded protein